PHEATLPHRKAECPRVTLVRSGRQPNCLDRFITTCNTYPMEIYQPDGTPAVGSRLESKRVVIVGGGFGGLAVARNLRRDPVEVTLIDRRNSHLSQPLLDQVATAALSPADIAEPIRRVLRHQKNAQVLLGAVKSVNLREKLVHWDGGVLNYDYLVIAAGA